MIDEEARALLERVKRKDDQAFRRLYLGCTQMIVKVARGILWKSEEDVDVEEVVTDTMMEVWEKPEAFEGRSDLMGWIRGIAKNKSLEKRRKRMQIRDMVHEDYEELVEVNLSAFQDATRVLEKSQDSKQLERCLAKLRSRQREIVTMRIYGEMKEREIAEIIGAPLGAIKSGYHYACRNLLNCLQGSFPGSKEGKK